MADRTWEERGRWMDKHRATIAHRGNDSTMSLYYVIYRPQACAVTVCNGPLAAYTNSALDAAMDECERLEREAAERAKAEEERTRQSRQARSPVAALLHPPDCPDKDDGRIIYGYHLRVAIERQCAIWRAHSDAPYTDGYRAALKRCADDLEGKTPRGEP